MGVSFWFFGFMIFYLVTEPPGADGIDYLKYNECHDRWDVQYPYLVEVRYTGTYSQFGRNQKYRYHRNRHGSLLTQKAVLTRAHDLDNFPDGSIIKPDAPLHTDIQSCMNGGDKQPCLYVNSRRPMNLDDPYNSEWCGSNSMVIKVYTHPKFVGTPNYEWAGYAYRYVDALDNLQILWQTMKFPFAVLELQNEITTDSEQTIFPAIILPRTPLEMLYMLRRMVTRGSKSKLCEFPHYDKLTNQGYYGPYDHPNTITTEDLNCSIDNSRNLVDSNWLDVESEIASKTGSSGIRDYCFRDALCPGKSAKPFSWSWEGILLRGHGRGSGGYPDEEDVERSVKVCEDLFFGPNVFPLSFVVFLGEYIDFDNEGGYWYYPNVGVKQVERRLRFDDKLGSPVVCNGVILAMVSSWTERGAERQNVYVATSLFRGWSWIIEMRKQLQVKNWHRAPDDHALLDAPFRKRFYGKRDYDKSIFELSLDEATDPSGHQFSQENRSQLDPTTTLFLLIFYVHSYC